MLLENVRSLIRSHQPGFFSPLSTGVEPVQVQETVENHLKSLLIKHFDPRKADSIFTEEGEVCMKSMLSSLHEYPLVPRQMSLCDAPVGGG